MDKAPCAAPSCSGTFRTALHLCLLRLPKHCEPSTSAASPGRADPNRLEAAALLCVFQENKVQAKCVLLSRHGKMICSSGGNQGHAVAHLRHLCSCLAQPKNNHSMQDPQRSGEGPRKVCNRRHNEMLSANPASGVVTCGCTCKELYHNANAGKS